MDARRPAVPFSRLIIALGLIVIVVAAVRLVTASDGTPDVAAPSGTSPRLSRAPAALPPCEVGDARARPASYEAWDRTLVDPTYGLKATYVPPDLVPVGRADFSEPLMVRKVLVSDLAALREAAQEAGNPVGLAAAFRSYQTQESLYRRRIDSEGHDGAVARTARPGHSEHQLGTTVDFKTAGQLDVTPSWEITPAGQWMTDNAWRYGFIMSYPKGQEAKVCYDFEPWHYRYFGRDLAARIHSSGLTVREFLWGLRR